MTVKDWLNPLPNLSKGHWSINCCMTCILKEVVDLKFFKNQDLVFPHVGVNILIESLHIFIPAGEKAFKHRLNSGSNFFNDPENYEHLQFQLFTLNNHL